MADEIKLSEVLLAVRRELMAANSAAMHDREAVMEFQECEVEFAVEVEKKGEAGIAVHFLKLGGGVKKSEQNTVRIKFKALNGSPLVAAGGSGAVGPQASPAPMPRRQTEPDAN